MAGKREEGKKKTFGNNPITIRHRAPYHLEEGMMMHKKNNRKSGLATRWLRIHAT
jgi:hypothetical protein